MVNLLAYFIIPFIAADNVIENGKKAFAAMLKEDEKLGPMIQKLQGERELIELDLQYELGKIRKTPFFGSELLYQS